MAVAQLVKKFVCAVLNGAVAQRIHADADRQPGQSIALLGARQHRSLIAQPIDVAEKSKHQHRGNADSNANLYASKSHPESKFIRMTTYGKITGGERERTCTGASRGGNGVYDLICEAFGLFGSRPGFVEARVEGTQSIFRRRPPHFGFLHAT